VNSRESKENFLERMMVEVRGDIQEEMHKQNKFNNQFIPHQVLEVITRLVYYAVLTSLYNMIGIY